MIDPQQLEEILEVLREQGATKFACPEFTVTLGAAPVSDSEDIGEAIRIARDAESIPSAARGIYGHPSLWPNGQPPRFPGSERSTPTHRPTHPDEEE